MKTTRCRRILFLVLLSVVAIQLPAQQTEADPKKWFEELKASAEKGDAQSQFDWGAALNEANHEVEAVKWYRKAAEQGHASAQFNLGVCYANGQGVLRNEVEAVKWYRKAAEHKDAPVAQAQFNLGSCYANGEGVGKDEAEAVKWYRKAAEHKDAPAAKAQARLGFCYANGDGVAKDEAEAVKWYRKAAEHKCEPNANAQFNLANCYANGRGVNKDRAEAVKWYRKAAEHESEPIASAQFNLGVYYAAGEGVAKDEVEAVKWYRKAAEQNDAQAQVNLGICYAKGEGVSKDEVEAAKWYRKAAEQGEVRSMFGLGIRYFAGNGVVKDAVEGYKWVLLAAGRGDEVAKGAMTDLESNLSREQITEGQKLARNFKPRKAPPVQADSSSMGIAQTRPESSGTGFFITNDGYLITNEHVAGNGAQVRLVTATGLIVAKVVKVDAANDLALLKAEGNFLGLPVTPSRTMKLGSTVATVGFPNIGLQGFAPKFARGEIASLSGAQDDSRYFQISVPVQPGNSGGALVDERGNVVGVVSAKLSARAALAATGALPENVNYAVKSSFLLSFLESVPEVSAKLKDANMKERKFEDTVKSAEQAAVLVLVY